MFSYKFSVFYGLVLRLIKWLYFHIIFLVNSKKLQRSCSSCLFLSVYLQCHFAVACSMFYFDGTESWRGYLNGELMIVRCFNVILEVIFSALPIFISGFLGSVSLDSTNNITIRPACDWTGSYLCISIIVIYYFFLG